MYLSICLSSIYFTVYLTIYGQRAHRPRRGCRGRLDLTGRPILSAAGLRPARRHRHAQRVVPCTILPRPVVLVPPSRPRTFFPRGRPCTTSMYPPAEAVPLFRGKSCTIAACHPHSAAAVLIPRSVPAAYLLPPQPSAYDPTAAAGPLFCGRPRTVVAGRVYISICLSIYLPT